MSDAYIGLPEDEAGKKVDAEALTVSGNTVHRQRILIADPTSTAGFAKVGNAQPAAGDYAVEVRQAPSGLSEAAIDISTATDTDVIGNVVAQSIRVWKLVLWANGDQTVTFKNGTATMLGPLTMGEGGELQLAKDGEPWFTCSSNQPFRITTTTTGRLVGRVYYTQG